jgi:putative ABC transport system ATP-binding protein
MSTSADVVIRVQDVTRVYEMGDETVRALDGVSLQVQRGEFLGLTGPSGSGKSTLLYVISGMDRPSSGNIWVLDKEITNMDENALAQYRRNDIGFVFQSFNLVTTMTALQNVEMPMVFANVPAPKRKERAKALLDQVGLGNRMHHKPNQMSGGQQQRVAIARALVNNPAIVFADEPTGNLDSKSGQDVMEMLHRMHADGRTIVLISHDPNVVAGATRVARLHDGKMVDQ